MARSKTDEQIKLLFELPTKKIQNRQCREYVDIYMIIIIYTHLISENLQKMSKNLTKWKIKGWYFQAVQAPDE